jgi:hypothetical protein
LIPRSENSEADKLAKATAQGNNLPSDVFYEVITQPLVEENLKAPKLINAVHSEDWRAPIVVYLKGTSNQRTKKTRRECSREHEGTR